MEPKPMRIASRVAARRGREPSRGPRRAIRPPIEAAGLESALPAVPVGDRLGRRAGSGAELASARPGHGEERNLCDAREVDAEELGGLALRSHGLGSASWKLQTA